MSSSDGGGGGGGGGGCPVMHSSSGGVGGGGGGGGRGACPVMHEKKPDTLGEAEYACADQVYLFNKCQTKLVPAGVKQHCEEEANALRACELARRKRERATKLYQECIKSGGDALECLKLKKADE